VSPSRERIFEPERFARAAALIEAETSALRGLADSVPTALVWLSPEGLLVDANRRAHDVAESTGAFTLRSGSLKWRHRDHQMPIKQCIATALAGRTAAVVLSRGEKPLLIVSAKVVTLPAAPMVPPEHRVALHIVPVSEPGPFPAPVLQSLYGLTPSEARLAHALATRRNLTRAASDAGLTVTTARSYLKRVFLKTGTSRQAQLVRLLWLQGPLDSET